MSLLPRDASKILKVRAAEKRVNLTANRIGLWAVGQNATQTLRKGEELSCVARALIRSLASFCRGFRVATQG